MDTNTKVEWEQFFKSTNDLRTADVRYACYLMSEKVDDETITKRLLNESRNIHDRIKENPDYIKQVLRDAYNYLLWNYQDHPDYADFIASIDLSKVDNVDELSDFIDDYRFLKNREGE